MNPLLRLWPVAIAVALALGASLLVTTVAAERDVAEDWCAGLGGELEHKLPDGTRVDCLTSSTAWEIDPGERWAEALGQALYYAVATGRHAGIALVGGTCLHRARLWAALAPVAGLEVRVVSIAGPSCVALENET